MEKIIIILGIISLGISALYNFAGGRKLYKPAYRNAEGFRSYQLKKGAAQLASAVFGSCLFSVKSSSAILIFGSLFILSFLYLIVHDYIFVKKERR